MSKSLPLILAFVVGDLGPYSFRGFWRFVDFVVDVDPSKVLIFFFSLG